MNELSKIPRLGAGIGLRFDLAEDTLAHYTDIETVEVIAEHYFSGRLPRLGLLLDEAAALYPIIPHGVDLSIGSTTPIEPWFLDEVKKLLEHLKAPYYSDHFALTRDGDELDIGHLSPLWFSRSMLENVIERVQIVQEHTGKPLVLENITAPFAIPGNDLEEPEFITEVCRRTGCGMLLDVTNVFINSYNFKHDAQVMLERYPLDSVIQMHLAGGVIEDDYFFDTHTASLDGINEGVWQHYEWAVRHTPNLKAIIIERDGDFSPDFEDMVLRDLKRVKDIWRKASTVGSLAS